ncbi:MAG: pyridoxamine 5'-phosphate oxidase family protein [Acidobacteria bacterium]|nr:pyridoxamine 5'-phosphate oxidase family protein [Acidobacteriota bacterium]
MKVKNLEESECRQILTKARLGRLACALDGQPYVVPFSFAYAEGDDIYAFSTAGQKIEWMRRNPKVCLEVEDIADKQNWTTIIVFGHYEELPDAAEFDDERTRARELLAKSPTWWQPAYFVGSERKELEEVPVFFKIVIDKITGHHSFNENFDAIIPPGQPGSLKKKRIRGLW